MPTSACYCWRPVATMTYQLSRMRANGSRISEARDTGSSKPSRTHTSMAAPFPWAWERCWAADPASTRWSGLAVTRATGTSLHQKQGTLRGAMNRCLIFIAASKTGRGHLIQDIAEPADRYLSSRCRIRTRLLQPCLREYARLEFRFLKIKTAGLWRQMVAHPFPTCVFAMGNANLFSVRMSSLTWTGQTSRCSPTRWLLG